MTRQELELKAKEFNSKLKRHPMSGEELQKVLCDFAETLCIHDIGRSEQLICPCCGSDKTYKTDAIHCNRCAVTTAI